MLKGDPDARLGIIVTFAQSKKEISYFWGSRSHVITDAKEELPVWEITKPANVHDSVMFVPLFDLMQREFHFDIHAVMADGIYDSASILDYMLESSLSVLCFTPNSSLKRDVIHISVSMMISGVKSITALSPSKKISICELDLNGSSQDCSVSVCKIPLLLVLKQQPTMLP